MYLFLIQVNETWNQLYREHFLKQALGNVQECRNAFYRRDVVKNEVTSAWCFDPSEAGGAPHYRVKHWKGAFFVSFQLGCNDVVLFWRIQKMLQTTSNAIRQQVMNHEGEGIFITHNLWVISLCTCECTRRSTVYIVGSEMEWNQPGSLGLEREWLLRNLRDSLTWLCPGLLGARVTQSYRSESLAVTRLSYITVTTIWKRGRKAPEKKKGRQLRCTLESKQQILPVHGRSFFGRREIFWLCLAIEDSSCVPQRVPLNTICSHLLLSAYYVSNKWLDLLSLLNMSLTCRSSSTRKRSKTSSRWD